MEEKEASGEEDPMPHTPLAQRSPQMEGKVGGKIVVGAKTGGGMGTETARTWEEDLIQGQEVPTEMLCSNEPSSIVSEQYMTHEGLSCPAPEQFPASRILSYLEPGVESKAGNLCRTLRLPE